MTGASPGARRSRLNRDLVENELYETAARLFAQKGFGGTSIQDIASAIGVSRQAIYYYVKSRDELIEKLVREMIGISRSLCERAASDPGKPADERLRALARGLALQVAERPYRHRLIAQTEDVLSGELALEHGAERRRFHRLVIALIEEGQHSGVFRQVNPRTAALSILGMCNWIAWWFHGDSEEAFEVAGQIADTAVRSLCDAAGAGAEDGPRAALARIRDGLRTLELALVESGTGDRVEPDDDPRPSRAHD